MASPVRSSDAVFRFHVFEVHLRAGELRKGGTRLKLQEQPWQVLVALLEHAGQVVTRDELRARLWPTDTFVDFDHSLNIAINKIRDVLGDDATKPRFVETVPRRGYRFIAPVDAGAPPPASPQPSVSPHRWLGLSRSLAIGVAVVLVLAAAGIAGWRFLSRPQHDAIAVLPLRNHAGPDAEYFSDALTDEIIYNLSVIDGLEVRSRTSSFQFKGKTDDVRKVGQQLYVDFVLEASVWRVADRLRLTVALVRAADDVQVWTRQYDHDMRDIFDVEEDISRGIANELRLRGIGGQRRYTTDPQTYDLYLHAVSLSYENSPGHGEPLKQAAAMLEQVRARDPAFTPADALLAEVYGHIGLRSRGSRGAEFAQRGREAAESAIRRDPLLPRAQAMLGRLRAHDLQWPEAEAAFRRALELDPNLETARADFATSVLEPQGRLPEALWQLRRAVALDPLSASRRTQLAFALLRAGKYDEALRITESVRADNPGEPGAAQLSARALLLKDQPQAALAILQKLGAESHAYLGYLYARLGRRQEAEQLAQEEDVALARHQVLIYAALGDYDKCFDALEQLARAGDGMASLYPGEPELAFLRNDPRMKAFRVKRGLP